MMRTVDVGQVTSVNYARNVELDWLHMTQFTFDVDISECLQHTVAKPIRLLWVDTNKGDNAKENYPRRSVVHQKRTMEEMVVRSL